MSGRGPDPEDASAWADLATLRTAVSELSWLLDRGYSAKAALKLVGDHHQLTRRQRTGVVRSSCGDTALDQRAARQVSTIRGQDVVIDGFNLLITLERAIAGGPILRGRDGACRDVAGVHGTYRPSNWTQQALTRVTPVLDQARTVRWLFDQPVSNSGRTAGLVRDHDPDWVAEAVPRPDAVLIDAEGVVVSSDGPILERCAAWFDLIGAVCPPDAWVVDLQKPS